MSQHSRSVSRRQFLARCGTAAAALSLRDRLALAADLEGGHPLAPQLSHYAPRAQRLLIIFLTGGFSHVTRSIPNRGWRSIGEKNSARGSFAAIRMRS